jgi:hypothetical protein
LRVTGEDGESPSFARLYTLTCRNEILCCTVQVTCNSVMYYTGHMQYCDVLYKSHAIL